MGALVVQAALEPRGTEGEEEECGNRAFWRGCRWPAKALLGDTRPIYMKSLVAWFLGKNGSAGKNAFETDSINEFSLANS